jgi:hypothetical protein
MKSNWFGILSIFTIVIYACGGYEAPKKIDTQSINLKIERGMRAGAEWVKTPQGIVKELIPKGLHKEGNSLYKVEEKRSSDSLSKVVIVEEGAMDDEVDGEQTVLNFRLSKGKWMVDEITKSVRHINR